MLNKINVEVAVSKPLKTLNFPELELIIHQFLRSLDNGNVIVEISNLPPLLSKDIDHIAIDSSIMNDFNNISNLKFHFYQLNKRSGEIEILDGDGSATDETPASNHWILPNIEFQGLWESLLYDDGIKENILNFAESATIFGKLNINKNIISCNRIILLHGPPGTGKTSLCKAIAQKLSIRMNDHFKFTHFIEINSHSLFSKWFSESGKLVQQLFMKIKEMILQPNALVCVLIDEIESIAYDRGSISGQEPRDSLRVVNAVLTQLDQIKQYSNVLILATSNLTSTIDLAFIDRVDIKQYIGLPSIKAIYEIYSSALNELMRVQLIEPATLMGFNNLQKEIIDDAEKSPSFKLYDIALNSIGMSGRALRKIPFLAHVQYSNRATNLLKIDDYLRAMQKAVEKHKSDEINLKNSNADIIMAL